MSQYQIYRNKGTPEYRIRWRDSTAGPGSNFGAVARYNNGTYFCCCRSSQLNGNVGTIASFATLDVASDVVSSLIDRNNTDYTYVGEWQE